MFLVGWLLPHLQVALLIQIGKEALDSNIVPMILETKDRRELAKYTTLPAPPHGLCLVSVKYKEDHLKLPLDCPLTSFGRHHTITRCKLPFYWNILPFNIEIEKRKKKRRKKKHCLFTSLQDYYNLHRIKPHIFWVENPEAMSQRNEAQPWILSVLGSTKQQPWQKKALQGHILKQKLYYL